MGTLVDGNWSEGPYSPSLRNGEFDRPGSVFRGCVDPAHAVPGRFHLYVSYACPWAHRTLITRALKKLEAVISVSVTNPYMGPKGWTFASGHDLEYLADVYRGADAHYTGPVTVPVLWDNRAETIVNNESSDIIRILNAGFNAHTDSRIDLYPADLQEEINRMNEFIYGPINNGVYKVGFASTQEAYDRAFDELFGALEKLEVLLGQQKYLVGEKLTESDVRLFTTLIRFDPVYYVHFKCNKKLIREYPALQAYLKSIYQIREVKETVHFDHIKEHYYRSHKFLNPQKLVPKGPALDLDSAHDRGEPAFHLVPDSEVWQ